MMNLKILSLFMIVLLCTSAAQAQRRDRREGSRQQGRDASRRAGQQGADASQDAGPQAGDASQAAGQQGPDAVQDTGQQAQNEPAGPETQGSDEPAGFRQQYKLILQRNIFSRDRRPYVPRERRTEFRPPPPPIETDYCLKGIARENDRLIAFFEQLSTGVIGRYDLNAKIARGTIKTISLDMVEYAMAAAPASNEPAAANRDDTPGDSANAARPGEASPATAAEASGQVSVTQVRIGQTLQGQASSGGGSFGTGFGATRTDTPVSTEKTPAEVEPLGDEASDILKRLMQRRQQELGN